MIMDIFSPIEINIRTILSGFMGKVKRSGFPFKNHGKFCAPALFRMDIDPAAMFFYDFLGNI